MRHSDVYTGGGRGHAHREPIGPSDTYAENMGEQRGIESNQEAEAYASSESFGTSEPRRPLQRRDSGFSQNRRYDPARHDQESPNAQTSINGKIPYHYQHRNSQPSHHDCDRLVNCRSSASNELLPKVENGDFAEGHSSSVQFFTHKPESRQLKAVELPKYQYASERMEEAALKMARVRKQRLEEQNRTAVGKARKYLHDARPLGRLTSPQGVSYARQLSSPSAVAPPRSAQPNPASRTREDHTSKGEHVHLPLDDNGLRQVKPSTFARQARMNGSQAPHLKSPDYESSSSESVCPKVSTSERTVGMHMPRKRNFSSIAEDEGSEEQDDRSLISVPATSLRAPSPRKRVVVADMQHCRNDSRDATLSSGASKSQQLREQNRQHDKSAREPRQRGQSTTKCIEIDESKLAHCQTGASKTQTATRPPALPQAMKPGRNADSAKSYSIGPISIGPTRKKVRVEEMHHLKAPVSLQKPTSGLSLPNSVLNDETVSKKVRPREEKESKSSRSASSTIRYRGGSLANGPRGVSKSIATPETPLNRAMPNLGRARLVQKLISRNKGPDNSKVGRLVDSPTVPQSLAQPVCQLMEKSSKPQNTAERVEETSDAQQSQVPIPEKMDTNMREPEDVPHTTRNHQHIEVMYKPVNASCHVGMKSSKANANSSNPEKSESVNTTESEVGKTLAAMNCIAIEPDAIESSNSCPDPEQSVSCQRPAPKADLDVLSTSTPTGPSLPAPASPTSAKVLPAQKAPTQSQVVHNLATLAWSESPAPTDGVATPSPTANPLTTYSQRPALAPIAVMSPSVPMSTILPHAPVANIFPSQALTVAPLYDPLLADDSSLFIPEPNEVPMAEELPRESNSPRTSFTFPEDLTMLEEGHDIKRSIAVRHLERITKEAENNQRRQRRNEEVLRMEEIFEKAKIEQNKAEKAESARLDGERTKQVLRDQAAQHKSAMCKADEEMREITRRHRDGADEARPDEEAIPPSSTTTIASTAPAVNTSLDAPTAQTMHTVSGKGCLNAVRKQHMVGTAIGPDSTDPQPMVNGNSQTTDPRRRNLTTTVNPASSECHPKSVHEIIATIQKQCKEPAERHRESESVEERRRHQRNKKKRCGDDGAFGAENNCKSKDQERRNFPAAPDGHGLIATNGMERILKDSGNDYLAHEKSSHAPLANTDEAPPLQNLTETFKGLSKQQISNVNSLAGGISEATLRNRKTPCGKPEARIMTSEQVQRRKQEREARLALDTQKVIATKSRSNEPKSLLQRLEHAAGTPSSPPVAIPVRSETAKANPESGQHASTIIDDLKSLSSHHRALVQWRDDGITYKECAERWAQLTSKRLSVRTVRDLYSKITGTYKQRKGSRGRERVRPVESQTHKGTQKVLSFQVTKERATNTSNSQQSERSHTPTSADSSGDYLHYLLEDGDEDCEPQVESLLNMDPGIVDSAGSSKRPTTGGKTMSNLAYQAYMASLEADADVDSASDVETMPESSGDEECIVRESSPIIDRDTCHFVYQVKRKFWANGENEDDAEWYIVTKKDKYEDVRQANIAAMAEPAIERFGHAYGLDVISHSSVIDMKTHMTTITWQTPWGHTKVMVDRYLRTQRNGIKPCTKMHWLPRQMYIVKIMTKTMKSEDDPDDPENLLISEEEATVDDPRVFTILDQANREAAKRVVDLTTNGESRRIDDIQKREQVKKRWEAAVDGMIEDGRSLDEEFRVVIIKPRNRDRRQRTKQCHYEAPLAEPEWPMLSRPPPDRLRIRRAPVRFPLTIFLSEQRITNSVPGAPKGQRMLHFCTGCKCKFILNTCCIDCKLTGKSINLENLELLSGVFAMNHTLFLLLGVKRSLWAKTDCAAEMRRDPLAFRPPSRPQHEPYECQTTAHILNKRAKLTRSRVPSSVAGS
ncbi:hypothetical protein EJ05DRAFT_534837 [Pseudovirgaria hyperparasitica]|uniref:Uncharacterized protein n=1 Tax=Pseudovirgaria hyperparasitica TaxID=470096 RepID=A0A6A6WMQ2_9PEZI|nr:uncharacterized protein EJ05DRAFT_534837 [Pseudovirgaria hyperparasitica]KAF2763507.1 hypothetical protein EJ05DRAFT_534837 [Pseudovirgaria hyperparasitica]